MNRVTLMIVGLALLGLSAACSGIGNQTGSSAQAVGAPAATQEVTAQPEATLPPATVAEPTALPPTDVPPTETPLPTVGNSSASFTVGVQPLANEFAHPIFVTDAGDGTDRLFVVEQPGQIRIIENGAVLETPFLAIEDKVLSKGNEQGLLGLVFDPQFTENGYFYVNYSSSANGDNIVERYKVSSDPNVADAGSGKKLLEIPGLEANHNGGMLAFGPDGYLYISTGDGGRAGDRHGTIGNGQDLGVLLGKILRIDVRGDPYSVPASNPFVGDAQARPEIWAYGLRNPWRFSFDRATGDLYIGDVGQARYEEVDFQPAASNGGENYGWRLMEGDACYNPAEDCDTTNLVLPVVQYEHGPGCAITGGYVYRGKQYPWLVGQYLFADYCSGQIWAAARDASGEWAMQQVADFRFTISSFGQDAAGELYVAGRDNGTIYKLTSTQ